MKMEVLDKMGNCEFDSVFKAKVGMSKQEKLDQANDVKRQTLQEVAGGSPRGTFANMDELRKAFPDGAVGVYITEDNGYWNYFDNETKQWASGGNYLKDLDTKQDKLVSGDNIATINGISLLNGGNINVGVGTAIPVNANTGISGGTPLKDLKLGDEQFELEDYYATKEEVNKPLKSDTFECADKVELTGISGCGGELALPETPTLMEIPTIKGQTRRKSLNLFKFPYILSGTTKKNGITCVVREDGSIVLNGTANGQTDFDLSTTESTYLKLNKGSTYTITNYGTNNNVGLFLQDLETYSTENVGNGVKEIVATTTKYYCWIRIVGGTTLSNYVVKPSVLLGTYSFQDLPPFQPYNDTLVNSYNVLKSTGLQLWDEKWEKQVDKIVSKNFIPIVPNQDYTLNKQATINYYDNGKQLIKTYENVANGSFKVPSDCYYIKFELTSAYGTTYNDDIMLNYGTIAKPYEPYKEAIISRCGELGQWDYIDNVMNKKHINTSKIITLDGSSDENYIYDGVNHAIVFNIVDKVDFNNQEVINNAPIIMLVADAGGLTIQIGSTQEPIEQIASSVEEFRTYLKSNPIQFSYKLATETIEDIVPPLEDTMPVVKGGMQIQEPIRDSLPYIVSKIYSLNLQAQVNANLRTDYEQQRQIDALIENDEQQDSKITQLESKDTQQDSKITQLESKDTQQDSKITQLENKITTNENAIARIENRVLRLEITLAQYQTWLGGELKLPNLEIETKKWLSLDYVKVEITDQLDTNSGVGTFTPYNQLLELGYCSYAKDFVLLTINADDMSFSKPTLKGFTLKSTQLA